MLGGLRIYLTLLKGCSVVGVFWGNFRLKETAIDNSTVIDLTGQTESLSITGGAQADTITAGSGDDIINGAAGVVMRLIH